MTKASELLEKAAGVRDMAQRALRLAAGLRDADKARLTQYSEELRERANELERQAAAGFHLVPPSRVLAVAVPRKVKARRRNEAARMIPNPSLGCRARLVLT